MSDTFMLSNIRNWRNCNAGIPDGYELAAVVDAVMGGWDSFDAIIDTTREGLSEADQDAVREIIEEYDLEVDPQEADAAIEAACRQRVAESRRKKFHVFLRDGRQLIVDRWETDAGAVVRGYGSGFEITFYAAEDGGIVSDPADDAPEIFFDSPDDTGEIDQIDCPEAVLREALAE